jgi:ankyrin repeat protein
MGWPSKLTYQEVAATDVARSVPILGCYGDVETAERLFTANPALADDPEALAQAARNGHEAFVRLMLRYQPGVATRIAVAARTRELTELLFQHGMDPNRGNWLRVTPLHWFAERGDIANAEIFIDHGADLDARDEELSSTPLAYAARAGKAPMVAFLLRRGAKPALPDDPPWATPLAWARRRGHAEIVRLLTGDENADGSRPA